MDVAVHKRLHKMKMHWQNQLKSLVLVILKFSVELDTKRYTDPILVQKHRLTLVRGGGGVSLKKLSPCSKMLQSATDSYYL